MIFINLYKDIFLKQILLVAYNKFIIEFIIYINKGYYKEGI